MQNFISQWPVSVANIQRILVTYLTLGAIAIISVTYLEIQTENELVNFLIVICAVSAYTHFIWLILKINKNKKFSIDAHHLEIPRLFRNSHVIPIKTICNIRYYKNERSVQMATLFLKSGRHIFIDRNWFISCSDFDEFIQNLEATVKSHSGVLEPNVHSQSFRDTIRTHFSGFAIFAMLCLAFFCTSDNFETVNLTAVTQGGLAKDILESNEWYRLCSSFFLHNNIWHLGLNVMMLGIILHPIEALAGRASAISILLSSAFFAAVFSTLISPYEYVIGASGGILGLMGACTVFYYRYKEEFHKVSMMTKTTMCSLVLFQIIGDILIPSVDIASHAAGFITGAISAYFLTKKISQQSKMRIPRTQIFFALALSLTFIFAFAFFKFTH